MSSSLMCRKCGGPVTAKAGPGRPRSYCSTGCRRAVEYELRRLQKALEDIEEQIRFCSLRWSGRRPDQRPALDAERVRLEDRLRDLLDDPETVTPT